MTPLPASLDCTLTPVAALLRLDWLGSFLYSRRIENDPDEV